MTNTLRPELQSVVDNSVVKDLSHKLGMDVARQAAEVSALVKKDIERAFIVLHAAATLNSIAGTLVIRAFPQMEPEDVWNVMVQYAEARKDMTIDAIETRRGCGASGSIGDLPDGLRDIIGSMVKGLGKQ